MAALPFLCREFSRHLHRPCQRGGVPPLRYGRQSGRAYRRGQTAASRGGFGNLRLPNRGTRLPHRARSHIWLTKRKAVERSAFSRLELWPYACSLQRAGPIQKFGGGNGDAEHPVGEPGGMER